MELRFHRLLEIYSAPPEYFPKVIRVYGMAKVTAAIGGLGLSDGARRRSRQPREVVGKQELSQEFSSHMCFKEVRDHPEEYINIVDYREAMAKGDTGNATLEADIKQDIKKLYMKILEEADIVLVTPSAAQETFFRENFNPSPVIIHQCARMRELTTVMAMTPA
ncbi:hypothetical protein F4774DRAFT_429486 [Daldinia eschscholtzii]|nr:hypothetical protein F4774DRAFT_429486 [Daldinia eschscholtzii]